ncbi:hypothetical protein [Cyclobacterium sp.]|uniref:hypothetical protein n=1 Tax=Cyclobacterium sp. TaxID=1966343 RepID=UPI0019885787|nr:hypothetical protein [Cyclobacterium sp.]MBD3627635.1 hypothetical protein [Cyclobacterium sp.]
MYTPRSQDVSTHSKKEGTNSPTTTRQPSETSMEPSGKPNLSQLEKDRMMLEDDIQRIHNKIEYDRSLSQEQIRIKYRLLDEHTEDLRKLTAQIKND